MSAVVFPETDAIAVLLKVLLMIRDQNRKSDSWTPGIFSQMNCFSQDYETDPMFFMKSTISSLKVLPFRAILLLWHKEDRQRIFIIIIC